MILDKDCNNLNNIDQLESELSNKSQLDNELNDIDQLESSLKEVIEVSKYKEYKGVSTDNIELIVDNEKNEISANIKPIQKKTHFEFPNVGSEKLIYIATEEKTLYFWDNKLKHYVPCGRDYNNIEVIDGGKA